MEASTLLDTPRLTEPTFDVNAETISSWKMDYCTTEKDYWYLKKGYYLLSDLI